MAVSIGSRLGPYEIVSAIGAGGMGEVYRARDTKLGRDVAIKVLPEAFARDAERMARFQREARVLASLDHPHIATIHGLEDSSGTGALVMQLVEGPTLADRIKHGPIPVDEAIRIARQIADALECAHERGIVHRDLKPANIKVAPDDTVKVLDFGLAKALEGDASSIDISISPTISRMATMQGVLLGTAAYMSPEQAKGKPVDRRADIWAFGCVLYEMLTGKRAFDGETVTDTLAAVIRADPDWSLLPAATPLRVRVLLQRCLQKDPKQRLRDIGDARISLDEVLAGAPEPTPAGAAAPSAKPWQLRAALGTAGLFALGMALFAFLFLHRKPLPEEITRFEIPAPENMTVDALFDLSPDGRKLIFRPTVLENHGRLWVRSMDAVEARPLEGTEGSTELPIWSPDGHFIAFPVQGKLKKMESTGGPPIEICNAPTVYGGAWTADDEIVFGSGTGIQKVSASGGSPSLITTGGVSITPSLLPDGRHFVYFRLSPRSGDTGIYVGSLDKKPEEQPSKRLLADTSFVSYAPTSDPSVGYLLFVRGAAVIGASGTLMAQPFDTRRLELTGEAVPIAEEISNVSFSVSATNALAYMGGLSIAAGGTHGNIRGQLAWFDREGKVLGTFGDPGVYRSLALSPDGKFVAFERAADPQNITIRNIWLYELARGVTTRFTFDSAWDQDPVWSPDGSRIIFTSNRGGTFDVYQKASNLAGEDEALFKSPGTKTVTSWSPDGRFILYFDATSTAELYLLPLSGSVADRKAIPFEHSDFNHIMGRFSPDGRWIAYASDESGKYQVYVKPFDASSATGTLAGNSAPVTGKWMVSKDGGTSPLWRRDGKELFYLSNEGMVMAVDVSTSGVFRAEIPKGLFKVPADIRWWDVSSDGKRFLMAAPSATGAGAAPKFTVVLNWQSQLKK